MSVAMTFNRGKFKELVVYLCASAEATQDAGFGLVKLNKLLYQADFEAYRLLGRPITGETYEKQEFGPVARNLPIVLDELAAAGRLRWRSIPKGDLAREVPGLTEEPDAVADMTKFGDDERQIITQALSGLSEYGGQSASEWSHEQSVGWKVASSVGEPIDYSSAVVAPDQIPQEDLDRARDYARERGWA